MSRVVTIDFGSTYTKAALFDVERGAVVGHAYAPTTIERDVREGLEAALATLRADTGVEARDLPALACSSAAGGLRVVVVGLVPSLSLEAAQRAALGAGAKIVGSFGYKLPAGDLAAIEAAQADILLLAGGTDGGDTETILHNAEVLARSRLSAPVIVAGNRLVSAEAAEILAAGGKTAILAANILPEVDRIAVDEVHAIIRDLFVHHITRAKGIEKVSQRLHLQAPIMPTPSAVLEAARLLAEGGGGETGLGDLILVDVGGATTDVHSVAHGAPTRPGVVQRGLPELYLKRTVEGDLGLRVNAATILDRATSGTVTRLADRLASGKGGCDTIGEGDVVGYVAQVGRRPTHIPADARECAMDAALGRAAVAIAAERHAGTVREVFTPTGTVQVQEGKDLSAVRTVIGVGGVLAKGADPRFVLEGALVSPDRPFSLRPQKASLLVDRGYVLYGVGLLAATAPGAALRAARQNLIAA